MNSVALAVRQRRQYSRLAAGDSSESRSEGCSHVGDLRYLRVVADERRSRVAVERRRQVVVESSVSPGLGQIVGRSPG